MNVDHSARGDELGLLFKFFQWIPTLIAAEAIVLPMDFCNVYSDGGRTRRAEYLLELVLSAVLSSKKS